MTYRMIAAGVLAAVFLLSCQQEPLGRKEAAKRKSYYVEVNGNDEADGSLAAPWKSIDRLNQVRLRPGDSVLFRGGQVFNGNIRLDSADKGSVEKPVVVTSYGDTPATIHGGDKFALWADNTEHIRIEYLVFTGNGRKQGNRSSGVLISRSRYIVADSLETSGFLKSGLEVRASSQVDIKSVYAHNNGFAGIHITGNQSKHECSDIYVGYCRAENNPGDPTNFTNHSGSGILAGLCRRVVIEYSSATNNGWDMPRQGNGPVGIWTYESDSVIIQYCESYRNRTSPGSADGGGFDLDGGVTNSVIQYCRSYENEGSGYGIFQYAGASPWNNNIIRHNISENDGRGNHTRAGVYIWNSSKDSAQFSNLQFHNNRILNDRGPCILYDSTSQHSAFLFYDNEFKCTTDEARY